MAKDSAKRTRQTIKLPPDVYLALKQRAAAEDSSVSAIVSGILERRFTGNSHAPLPLGPRWTPEWVNASVFLPADLLRIAREESERQHGATRDARERASVRVIAGLVKRSVKRARVSQE